MKLFQRLLVLFLLGFLMQVVEAEVQETSGKERFPALEIRGPWRRMESCDGRWTEGGFWQKEEGENSQGTFEENSQGGDPKTQR